MKERRRAGCGLGGKKLRRRVGVGCIFERVASVFVCTWFSLISRFSRGLVYYFFRKFLYVSGSEEIYENLPLLMISMV